jgi:hypothetical protein
LIPVRPPHAGALEVTMRSKLSLAIASLAVGLLCEAPALAGEAGHDAGARIDRRLDRRGERIDHRLDRRGERIDDRLDARSNRAAALGFTHRAQRLDRRGDRIENRLDRRGDRIENRLDRRGDRIENRLDRAK